MNISAASRQTGLSGKTIRDYEQAGLLHPARATNGYRHYTGDDIETLLFIRHAREVDFSLAQIATLLALRNNPHRASADVKQLVGRHLTLLSTKIEQLSAMKATLQGWYDHCCGNDSPDCAIINGLNKTAIPCHPGSRNDRTPLK